MFECKFALTSQLFYVLIQQIFYNLNLNFEFLYIRELHFVGTYVSVVCVPVTMCPPDDVIFNNHAIIFGIVHCRGFYRCNLAN
jgi:hypothetical protein